MKKKTKKKATVAREIDDYDATDVSESIDTKRPLRFEDLGLQLPEVPPTQVVSIRLPTQLINELKSRASQNDIPYQALIKLYLAESLRKRNKAA
jgi:predicted DNA binding CopG/RHH family protein